MLTALSPLRRILAGLALLGTVAACDRTGAGTDRADAPAGPAPALTRPLAPGELYVGLAFSGGGHRASAFSYGVLQELAATGAAHNRHGLAGEVRFLAGVSGGAVTAAWFALHGPAGLPAFRGRYLLRNAERYVLVDPRAPGPITPAVQDRVLARDSLAPVLDAYLFAGATFARLGKDRPVLRIVASDLARGAPFVFSPETLSAVCRNLARMPLSQAVAASAAFPAVFRPIVLPVRHRACAGSPPPPLRRLDSPEVQPVLARLAAARQRYGDPRVDSVHLADGGLTDVYGTAAVIAALAESRSVLGPMTPEQAVRVREILFLAVDASIDRSPTYRELIPTGRLLAVSLIGLPQRLRDKGPEGLDMEMLGDALRATTTDSFPTLRAALADWQHDIIAWRCGLDRKTAAALYGGPLPADWSCRSVTLVAGLIRPADLPPDLRRRMREVPTRLHLPQEDIDMVVAAGRLALRQSKAMASLIRHLDAAR